MKLLSASLLCLAMFASNMTGAETPRKTPYFRPKQITLKPRQAGPAVVNAASFLPGVSPGGLASIFGQDLSSVTGTLVATTNPLPTQLADVSVSVNGVLAPLFVVALSASQDQINFQVPYETPTGPGAADIEILNDGNPIASIQADSFTEDPGIFEYQGNYAVALNGTTNSLIGPNNPALPGDVVVLYVTGLGPLNQNLVDGFGGPSNPPADTVDPFEVLVAGEQCTVLFSGLAPGFVGLYQINLVLPGDLPAGNLDIQIQSQYANSQTAQLPVD